MADEYIMVMQATRNSLQAVVMRDDIKVIFIFRTIHYIRQIKECR